MVLNFETFHNVMALRSVSILPFECISVNFKIFHVKVKLLKYS